MSRSSTKGPFVNARLLKKVLKMTAAGQKSPIKTWARSSSIPPEFIDLTFLVHNSKVFKEVFINKAIVGHKLNEFSPTRTFHGHGKIVKRIMSKT